ncbi:hypothetical protein K438DRAFT_1963115 [Mycena galopus ATCC 62051]|nr:hypothetical protein K438DRAFT_1963115 [Mycena galopus ATCC 62051]
MTASFQPLTISIVGAGIGGLAAAVALRRNGHYVQIFEAAEIKTKIAGILTVQINALKVLDRFGVSRDTLKGVPWQGTTVFSFNSGEGTAYPWLVPATVGNGLICRRIDLHEELKGLAIGEGEGPPAKLHLGTKVVACDVEEGTVTLDGGEFVHADCILGADGMHSVIRTHVLGSVTKPQDSGFTCFRVILEAENLRDIPELEWVYTDISVWAPTATREEFIDKFHDFDPKFLRILDLPTHSPIQRWTLRAIPLLPNWVLGRAALLGDAVHATVPLLGQGAAMAVEEGAALGCLLPAGTRREDIPARLEAYQHLRKQRGELVNTESVEQGPKGFPFLTCRSTEEMQRYLLEYDAVKEAEECYQEGFGGGISGKA